MNTRSLTRYLRRPALQLLLILIGLAASTHASALVTRTATISYSINSGATSATRTFKIQILRKGGIAQNSLPAVIYSHGGAHGTTNGHQINGQNWANFLADEDYLVINIEHRPLADFTDVDIALAACGKVNLGATGVSATLQTELGSIPIPADKPVFNAADIAVDSECYYFQHQQYLRKRDVQAVYNLMGSITKISNWWDDEHIVLMGHSAGNAAVMTWAGAERSFLFDYNTYEVSDKAKFDAYISLSPQNETVFPYIRGYNTGAFDDIAQPVLSITSEQDITGETSNPSYPIILQSTDGRREPFLQMKSGPNPDNKYLLWVKDDNVGGVNVPAIHNVSALNAGSVDQQAVVKETALHFLDMYVGGSGATLDDALVDTFQGGNIAEFCTFDAASSGDPAVCE